MIELSWNDIYERLSFAPQGRLYGIPRGGSIVAGLTGRPTESFNNADCIVDDIVDTGATREKYAAYGKRFWALVDKQREGIKDLVKFPWDTPTPAEVLENTVIKQLEFIGEDPTREGLKNTPGRVIRSLTELTEGYKQSPKELLSTVFEEPYDEMVLVRRIEFWSLCEHHMLPFHGFASVGYLPNKKVVGLSKIARLVHCFAKRLQIQERLTQEIAVAINSHLAPEGVGVVIEAEHTCMAMRGVKSAGKMVTSALLGAMRERPAARAEFFSLTMPNNDS
ncbi:MAG: GTP cyclohydrolase I FolE [Deltaproteobacteria bacterium]|nr:GTP cyclohydrolase I FolE [Deltaproteobacteria bacterium]